MTPARASADLRRAHLPAPAKVNLYLRVLGREGSGYHRIETLFAAIDLFDEVEVAILEEGEEPPGEGGRVGTERAVHLEIATEGPGVSPEELGPAEQNLTVRAAEAFLDEARRIDPATAPTHLSIRLLKRIPVGAGLGGGSSDAAAVLRAMAALVPAVVSRETLHTLASGLGADVPFFLGPASFALGRGRGDRLLALPPPEPIPLLLCVPHGIRIPTGEAYRRLAEARRPHLGEEAGAGREASVPGETDAEGELAPVLSNSLDLNTVIFLMHNDFDEVMKAWRPEIGRVASALVEAGARRALLSGSGSAVFGVFPSAIEALRARDTIEHSGVAADLYLCHTLGELPPLAPAT